MSETASRRPRINPGYSFHVADAELDANMKPAEIVEALSMLRFTSSESRRTVGLDRETCRYIVERLRCS
jgi:hypothetical protein